MQLSVCLPQQHLSIYLSSVTTSQHLLQLRNGVSFAMGDASSMDIPKQGWGGVVVNEGPDFHVEVQKLDVPEPSKRVGLGLRRHY